MRIYGPAVDHNHQAVEKSFIVAHNSDHEGSVVAKLASAGPSSGMSEVIQVGGFDLAFVSGLVLARERADWSKEKQD